VLSATIPPSPLYALVTFIPLRLQREIFRVLSVCKDPVLPTHQDSGYFLLLASSGKSLSSGSFDRTHRRHSSTFLSKRNAFHILQRGRTLYSFFSPFLSIAEEERPIRSFLIPVLMAVSFLVSARVRPQIFPFLAFGNRLSPFFPLLPRCIVRFPLNYCLSRQISLFLLCAPTKTTLEPCPGPPLRFFLRLRPDAFPTSACTMYISFFISAQKRI